MEKNTYIFATPEEVAQNFAEWLYLAVIGSEKDAVHIALSGGSTPQLLFKILADKYQTSFPWQKVHFWWGDERCVDPKDIDSNYGVAKSLLFDHISIPSENIHRVLGENEDTGAEADRYGKEIEQLLESVDHLPSFDLIILGMGDDGHTASIFPHQIELMQRAEICAVARHPVSQQSRITLTGKVLNNAMAVAFLVTGRKKAEKYHEIVHQNGEYETYPAAHIRPKFGGLHWFVDKAVIGE